MAIYYHNLNDFLPLLPLNKQKKATLENWMLAQRLTCEQAWELEFTSEVQQSSLKIEQASYSKNIWKLKLEGNTQKTVIQDLLPKGWPAS